MAGPYDGVAWSHMKSLYSQKIGDPRSVHLGLAMDGMSPFAMSGHLTPYSIWPIMLTLFNLPSWCSTKAGFSWVFMILPSNLTYHWDD